MYFNIILPVFIIIVLIIIIQNSKYKLDEVDIYACGINAGLYLIIHSCNIFVSKQTHKIKEVVVVSFIMLLLSILNKLTLTHLYPKADLNKDGVVSMREFIIWKHKVEELENKLNNN